MGKVYIEDIGQYLEWPDEPDAAPSDPGLLSKMWKGATDPFLNPSPMPEPATEPADPLVAETEEFHGLEGMGIVTPPPSAKNLLHTAGGAVTGRFPVFTAAMGALDPLLEETLPEVPAQTSLQELDLSEAQETGGVERTVAKEALKLVGGAGVQRLATAPLRGVGRTLERGLERQRILTPEWQSYEQSIAQGLDEGAMSLSEAAKLGWESPLGEATTMPPIKGGAHLETLDGPWAKFVDAIWEGRDGVSGIRGFIQRRMGESPYGEAVLRKVMSRPGIRKYGLPASKDFEAARIKLGVDQNLALEEYVGQPVKDLKVGFTPAERTAIYEMQFGSQAPSQEIADKYLELAAINAKAGEEAVLSGALSRDSYDFFLGHFSRIYKDKLGGKFADIAGVRPRQYSFEGQSFRGLRAEVPLDEVPAMLADAETAWRVFKMPKTQIPIETARTLSRQWAGSLGLTEKQFYSMLEKNPTILAKQMRDAGLLFRSSGQSTALRQILGEASPAEDIALAKQWQKSQLGKVKEAVEARAIVRREIPRDVAEELGEYKDPIASMVHSWTRMIRDTHLQKFYKGVRANPSWTVQTIEDVEGNAIKMLGGQELPEEALAELMKETTPYYERLVQLPNSNRLGSLADQIVRKPIADELMASQTLGRAANKYVREFHRFWKEGKVTLNPATWGRNHFSNIILNHVQGGVPWYRQDIYGSGFRDLYNSVAKGAKHPEFLEAQKAGLFRGQWAQHEINSIRSELEVLLGAETKAKNPLDWFVQAQKKGLRITRSKGGRIYQFLEDWGRFSNYRYLRGKGLGPKAAADKSVDLLFDYGQVGESIEWLRNNPLGSPFVTFTYKALPRMFRAAAEHPIRFGSIPAMMYGINAMGGPEDRTRKYLPWWAQNKSVVDEWLTPWVRIPGSGPGGPMGPETAYFNLTWWLPWGDIGETGEIGYLPRAVTNFVPGLNAPVRPLFEALANFRVNGPPVTPAAMGGEVLPTWEAVQRRTRHAARGILPTVLGTTARRVSSAAQGKPAPGQYTAQRPLEALLGTSILRVDPRKEIKGLTGEQQAIKSSFQKEAGKAARGYGQYRDYSPARRRQLSKAIKERMNKRLKEIRERGR